MRRVVLLAEAADDLAAAKNFYGTREPGVGDFFVDSLLSDVEGAKL